MTRTCQHLNMSTVQPVISKIMVIIHTMQHVRNIIFNAINPWRTNLLDTNSIGILIFQIWLQCWILYKSPVDRQNYEVKSILLDREQKAPETKMQTHLLCTQCQALKRRRRDEINYSKYMLFIHHEIIFHLSSQDYVIFLGVHWCAVTLPKSRMWGQINFLEKFFKSHI